jgi:hypothetical protein
MANLTSVSITNGAPTAGTGTVSTLDNLIGISGTPSPQVLSVQGALTSDTPVQIAAQTALPVEVVGIAGAMLTHFSAAGSTLIKTGSGWVADISINTTAASGNLTIYDGTSTAGAVMAVIDVSKSFSFGGVGQWPFTNGLFVVITGSPDITIVSR